MKTTIKVALGVGSAGTLIGTGVAIHNHYSGISIKEHIENNKKSNSKIFLTSKTTGLSDILTAYQKSNRVKPKDEKGKVIPKEKLAEWCEKAVNDKFIDENSDNYKGIISWCYININNFKAELESNGKDIVSTATEGDQVWKNAWKEYKKDRGNPELKITEATYDALNKEVEVDAGKAMHKWCTETHNANKKLYEDGAEKDYDRFIRWCSKDK